MRQLFDGIAISSLSGVGLTVAWVQAEAGAMVPTHQHAQEQVTVVISGVLRVTTPDSVIELGSGQAVHLPSSIPHSAEVVSAAIYIDAFHPTRADFGLRHQIGTRETE